MELPVTPRGTVSLWLLPPGMSQAKDALLCVTCHQSSSQGHPNPLSFLWEVSMISWAQVTLACCPKWVSTHLSFKPNISSALTVPKGGAQPRQCVWEQDPFLWQLLQARHSACKTESLNPGQMAKSLLLRLSVLAFVERQLVWMHISAVQIGHKLIGNSIADELLSPLLCQLGSSAPAKEGSWKRRIWTWPNSSCTFSCHYGIWWLQCGTDSWELWLETDKWTFSGTDLWNLEKKTSIVW